MGETDAVRDSRSLARDLVAVTKPGITFSNALMAGAGLCLASAPLSPLLALGCLVGTALVVASANAFNMALEGRIDARMARTRARPVAAGRLTARAVVVLALSLGVLGVLVLALISSLVAWLGGLAIIAYAFIYTPLKTRTPLALLVGAVPGAVPPALGVLALTPSDLPLALALSGLLFVWQLPHFLAIAARREGDYAAGGIRALPVTHGPAVTRTIARVTALGLLPLSLLGPLAETAGTAAATALGVLALAMFTATMRRDWVGPTFGLSLAYLPALFAVTLVHRLL